MSHRHFLQDEILQLLGRACAEHAAWHSEPELEDFLIRQGYERDLVQDLIDQLIDLGLLDFMEDRQTGNTLIAFSGGEAERPPGLPLSN